MNILSVTLGFYPAPAWGGTVKVVQQNSMELLRRGHQVTIYCSNLLNKKNKIQPTTFESQVDSMRVVYFDTWHFPYWPGTLGPFWWPELSRYLERELPTFDVVHVHGYRSLVSLAVARTVKRAGKPVIIQPHGTLPVIVNTVFLKRLYDRVLGRREVANISVLIALQSKEREQALAVGVPEERIVVIPNGLQPPEPNSLPPIGAFRKKHELPQNRPLILFLGRVNRKKGTDMLIEAFAQMKDKSPMLIIAGPDDGQLGELKILVERYDLEKRILFTGLLQGDDVWSAYRDADLFVLPCRTDTFPMTILEACAMGTPVLTTNTCEIASLVHGRFGETVPFDAKEFAFAMENLLNNEDLRRTYMANMERIMNQEFSIQAVGKKLERVYQLAVDGCLPERPDKRIGTERVDIQREP